MKTSVRTITPAIAAKLLENTTLQRPVRQPHVDWLAGQMRDGKWKLNGETIILDGDKVLDGQHRLWACVESGVTFEVVVVEGVDASSFSTIDTGKVRDSGDIVSIALGDKKLPVPVRRSAATAIKFVLAVDETGRYSEDEYTRLNRDHTAVAQYAMAHPDVIELTKEMLALFSKKGGFTVSHLTALVLLVQAGYPDMMESFIKPIANGTGLYRQTAIYAYREKCLAIPNPLDFRLTRDRFAILIRAWNAHATNTPVGVLRYRAGTDMFPSLQLRPDMTVKNRRKA